MRRRALFVVATIVIFILARPVPAAAWGFEAHKLIMERAIALLPPAVRPFFERYRVAIVEHAIDPDLWRTAGWTEESSRHFVDMDAYGAFPFADLPHDYAEAVKRRGEDFVKQNGTLPWRAEEIYGKLVEAFEQEGPYARENIKFFSSVIAHYTADAHVPFHAALNHDGQLTAQWGIHARFETDLFERYRSTLRLTPRPVVAVGSAREFIFASLLDSFGFVQPILDADRIAVGTRERYDDGYFTAFFGKVRPILEKRLSESITAVASIITSAWIQAGRPAVPVVEKRLPKKVRK